MKYFIIFFLASAAWAQPDIASIVENDPFDPDRGRKEVTEEQVLEEEAPPPVDLPVLDGTMVIGKKKIALFSYMEEGKRKYQSASLNEVVAGYKVTSIQDREVKLSGGNSPVSLKLFSGDKTKRGGSKKAAKAPAAKKPRAVARKPNNGQKEETKIISPNAAEDSKEKPKKRFVPRKPQTQKPKPNNPTNKKLKNRF